MFLKHIFISLFIIKLCSCKSLSIVIDTTNSMKDELDIIKTNIASAIPGNASFIDNYILIPFKDPDVLEPVVVDTAEELINAVNRLRAGGGNECPENSLSAIERALQISKPKSHIFMFTDAYAKDIAKLKSIENLCRKTRSQVVIFVTSYCLPTRALPYLSVQTYYEVAKTCSGTVLRLNSPNLREVFKYMNEVLKEEWTEVISYEPFNNYKEITFLVNSFTKSVLLAVSGKHPSVIYTPAMNSSSTFENILETRHAQVISLLRASPGEYRVTIRCQGTTLAVLYKKIQMPLQIGFSTEKPRSLKETTFRPIPDKTNYLFIEVSIPFKLEHIAIEVIIDRRNKTLELNEILNENIYLTKTFIEPDKSFCIWINGYDKVTLEKMSGSTAILIPQVTVIDPIRTKPSVEIIDNIPLIVNYGMNRTVACKVNAYPKPRVWWEDEDGDKINTSSEASLLEIPSLYISYVHLTNVMKNYTIFCKSDNTEGEDSKEINVYVYRPFTFEILQTPENQTIEYGTDGKLYCQVSAYPEAEIKWYYNDSIITEMDDIFEILPDEYALQINNMNFDKIGEFKCEISNVVNTRTYRAYVDISGIEAPQLEVDESDVFLKLGDRINLKCRVTQGKPLPEISWEFKPEDSFIYGPLPKSVVTDGENLKITSAQNSHNGTYRCNAKNIEGQNSVDINIIIQSPPTILNSESETVVVKEGDDVTLSCDVTGSPTPTVRWEMSQDDVLMTLDDSHQTDEHHTHTFKALWKDSGNYHCVAENSIGRAEKTITVNVLVKPYIESLSSELMTVRAGDAVSLPCHVTYGNPVPITKWEFTPINAATRVLKRSNSSIILNIPNVRYSDEGSYACVADNVVGTDNIQTYLKIQ